MEYLQVLFWALIGSVFSLVGGLLIVSRQTWRQAAVRFGLPFGAGALLAAAFLSILPEAMHAMKAEMALVYALGGFLTFFMLERLLGWFHHHEHHHHSQVHGSKDATHRWLVIIGDTAHNAIDGLAIGAAFLVDPAAGIGTALAVAAHEIPQELGDFSILLGKGMRSRHVVIVNLLSALATVVAALGMYAVGTHMELNPAPLLAIAAGFFIYIAASDIIPDIHEQPRQEGNRQTIMLLIGVAVLASVITLMPHEHPTVESGHDHGDVHEHDEHAH